MVIKYVHGQEEKFCFIEIGPFRNVFDGSVLCQTGKNELPNCQ